MLFGWNRVGPGSLFATCMVALGTIISTFWILASNSWMQTPQGFEIVNGQVVPVDWFAVIFNPSFPYRLLHMSVAALSQQRVVCRRIGSLAPAARQQHARRSRDVLHGLVDDADCRPGSGHDWRYARAEYAPAGENRRYRGALGEYPRRTHPAAAVRLAGYAAGTDALWSGDPGPRQPDPHHSLDKQVPALKEFAAEDRPNATIVFWSFRLMAGLGMLMILLGALALWLRYRGRLYHSRPFYALRYGWGHQGLSLSSRAG